MSRPLAAFRSLIALSVLLPLGTQAASAAKTGAPPNIVLIFVDDMGYGDLGCYGGSLIPTPQIDSLAEKGMRFTQGYSISPVCGPSRVGLLSGLQPSRLGVYWNQDMGWVQMPPRHPILPEALKAAGYTTGLVGKWNLNPPHGHAMPSHNYFDRVYDAMVWEGDYWPDANGAYQGVADGNYGSGKQTGQWGPLHEGDEYLTDRLTRNACAFIAESKYEPFFLYLAYNAPHSPLQGKRADRSKLTHIQSEALKHYASMLLAVDAGVGQILSTLTEAGLDENTLILFMSDNGPALTTFKGIPQDWPRGQMLGSTSGLRGHKGTFWEGGIRVPLLAYWPARIKASTISKVPVTSLDVYPTVCAVANAKLSSHAQLDGHNLLPLLTSEQGTLPERTLLWFSGKAGAVRRGDWKLHFNAKDGFQLFHLRDDRAERVDRTQQQPHLAAQLTAVIDRWRGEIPPPMTPRK
jgi:arylsulfatase A-like enzyme